MSHPVADRFIEDAGNLTQSVGLGRVLGQVYAYIYFSPAPRNLADMQAALVISKGSASTAVRQLEQWQAVRKVWVKGDRKDYYVASDWFGQIVKSAVMDLYGKRMASYAGLLDEVEADLAKAGNGDGDGAFLRERIAALRAFQKKAQWIWNKPVFRRLLR